MFPVIIAPPQNEMKDVEIGKKTLKMLLMLPGKYFPLTPDLNFPSRDQAIRIEDLDGSMRCQG